MAAFIFFKPPPWLFLYVEKQRIMMYNVMNEINV